MFVNDIPTSTNWYKEFFKIQPVEASDTFTSFKIGNQFFNLHPADSKSPVSVSGSITCWEVENLGEAIKKAESLGASVYRGPLAVKETGRTICQIRDPLGNVFGLEAKS